MPKKANSHAAIEKPVRTTRDFKFRYAEALKPPLVGNEDEDGDEEASVPIVVYVAQGIAHFSPATPAAFARVAGKRFARRPHSGLYRRIRDHFLVCMDKDEKVVAVDNFPEALYGSSASSAPTSRRNAEHITMTVDLRNGDISVTELPPVTVATKAAMRKLLLAIHALKTIESGMEIEGYEVVSVAGNTMQLEPLGSRED